MSDSTTRLATDPWIWIIGIGEDGLNGLSQSSRDALARAEIVFGGPRHLKLAEVGARGRPWPAPFSVDPVLDCRSRRVAVLASGDPFWHGAGGSLAAHLTPSEWIAFPAPSTFSLAATRLGWRLEDVNCLGLHAAPFETLLPHLAPAQKAICLLRDGAAAGDLAAWLTHKGFGKSLLSVMESLGGPAERIRTTEAASFDLADVTAPVAAAIVPAGAAGLPRTAGLPDDAFIHDGQITKRPVRALTLSALAPRVGQMLWDIGAGSGSISVEWCLAGGKALAIEARSDRAGNIRANAAAFGVADRLTVIEGEAPAGLEKLVTPNAVFVGGGGDQALFDAVWTIIPRGTRLVANAVTLETEVLLLLEQKRRGGELMRIELSQAAPLGNMRGWVSARPLLQWSVVR
jgi:precorrin-6B C5,15-methyltransferase / cobalt-precorrin-6B C5,C15-methyltransferase